MKAVTAQTVKKSFAISVSHVCYLCSCKSPGLNESLNKSFLMRTSLRKENCPSSLVIYQTHPPFDCLQWRKIDFRSMDLWT